MSRAPIDSWMDVLIDLYMYRSRLYLSSTYYTQLLSIGRRSWHGIVG